MRERWLPSLHPCPRRSCRSSAREGWLNAGQLRPVAELDGNGDVVSRFVYGTKVNVPEYIIKNGTAYRIFSDHLGSPRVIVDAATGAVVQRMDFHPFGEIIQDSNPGWQPFGFAGGLHDRDTGLVRFGKRDYDAATGRWTSKDGVDYLSAETNRFSYVQQNPVDSVEPTGEFGPAGALWGAACSIAGQAYDNYMSGKSLTDPSNYDVTNVFVDAAVGAVAPGALGALKTLIKAPGAVSKLSRQLETAVSAARRAKLEARLAKYTSELANTIGAAATWQISKRLLKNELDEFSLGDYCPFP